MRTSHTPLAILLACALAACGGNGGAPAATHAGGQSGASRMDVVTGAPTLLAFSGPLANYDIGTDGAGQHVVLDKTGKDGTRTVAANVRLRFTDTSLAFDVDGTAGQAYRLYQAAFNRGPDAAGLGYWIHAMDGGASLMTVAEGFVASAEFTGVYGTAPASAMLVDGFYQNVLHRAGDSGGRAYWIDVLDRRVASVAVVLAGFSDGPENRAGLAATLAGGIAYSEPGVSYPDAPHFPLRAVEVAAATVGSATYLVNSGACGGSMELNTLAPVATSFLGHPAQATTMMEIVRFASCTPASSSFSGTSYRDGDGNLLGTVDFTGHVGVVNQGAVPVPVSVQIGDAGPLFVQTFYADSSLATVIGTQSVSYAVEADGAARDSAIVKLAMVSADASGQATYTQQSRSRIKVDGSYVGISNDIVNPNNGARFVYTAANPPAQPPALTLIDTVAGSGAEAASGQVVTVSYTAWLYAPRKPGYRGTQFDSTAEHGPLTFTLGAGQMIDGFDQGVLGMKVGAKRLVLIPSAMAYGAAGAGAIPPDTAIMYEIELLSVKQ